MSVNHGARSGGIIWISFRRLIEAILMSSHNIPFLNMKKKIQLNTVKLSQIYSYGVCSKGLKNESEIAVVNEPSVFKPPKFYCIFDLI